MGCQDYSLTSSALNDGCTEAHNNQPKFSSKSFYKNVCTQFLLHVQKQQEESIVKLANTLETYVLTEPCTRPAIG
jgi:hypothetical protein